jgi:SAM-dependent methyltransferase
VANEKMRELWTKRSGPGWLANRHVFAAVFAPVSKALIDAAEPLAGRHVLDIGCGTGDLSGAVADRGATPIGADISATMVTGAQEQYPDLRFEVADVQTDDLTPLAPDGFDVVVSKFGVMFFEDPVAAFTNVRRATKPGGRLFFVCWRTQAENEMFTLGTHLLIERMPDPPPPPEPGKPGPTGFADPHFVADVLGAAGWRDIDVALLDVDLRFGIDGSDGVEERLAVVLAGSTGSLAAEQLPPLLGERAWQALLDEIRAEVRTRMVDGAVQFPGRMWLVTASNPS